MGLTFKEVKELKIGNTVKVVKEYSKESKISKDVYLGKYVSLLNKTNYRGEEEYQLNILGYQEGEYKLKEISVTLSKYITITRSRLTGKSSEAVNNYFKKYIEHVKNVKKKKEQIRREEELMRKKREELDEENTKISQELIKSNYDNLPNKEKIVKELESRIKGAGFKYDVDVERRSGDDGFYIRLTKYGLREDDLRRARIEAEYDYSTYIDGTKEAIQDDVTRNMRYASIVDDVKLKGVKDCSMNYYLDTDGGHKIGASIVYWFVLADKKLNEKEVTNIVSFIESKILYDIKEYQ